MTVTDMSPAREIVNRGALLHLDGDVEGAEAAYRDAIALDPGNVAGHANLGFLLAATGDVAGAVEHCETAVVLDPERSITWGHLGAVRLLAGDVEDGFTALGRAVRLDPANAEAWDTLARANLALGNAVAAVDAWAAAAQVLDEGDPRRLDALVGLATALSADDELVAAADVLRGAATEFPYAARAWTQLGVVCLVRCDHGSAAYALERALTLDPSDQHARFHMGVLAVVVGDLAAAADALTRVTEDPTAARAPQAAELLSKVNAALAGLADEP